MLDLLLFMQQKAKIKSFAKQDGKTPVITQPL
jgi:hypothetical protein